MSPMLKLLGWSGTSAGGSGWRVRRSEDRPPDRGSDRGIALQLFGLPILGIEGLVLPALQSLGAASSPRAKPPRV
jgi:hypothetical protein